MSSLRNAVKRIAHKERSQPVERQHLGILEKKKDYKKRAIDYHHKEDRIKAMRLKASMRNPDEFYFQMHKSKMKEGQHKSDHDYRELDPDLVKVMKDQDLSFVRMQKQKDTKKVERLQASLQFLETEADTETDGIGVTSKRKHTIFVESQKEAEDFDVAEYFDTIPEFAGRVFNRLRKGDVEKLASSFAGELDGNGDGESNTMTMSEMKKHLQAERKQALKLAKARSSAYGELEARRERAEQMKRAEAHLVTEKLVSSKGRKRKIKAAENGQPAQYQWRRKRLR